MNYSTSGLKKEHSAGWSQTFLEWETLERIIPQLRAAGVCRVAVTGNGEPFAHDHILDVVKLIKKNGMKCEIRTNGLLIDQHVIGELLRNGLDGIDVSVWAGSPEGYVEVHPGETQLSFQRIKQWLLHLRERRAADRNLKRHFKLKIINVLAGPNYQRTEEMLSFGALVGADYVLFKPFLDEFFTREGAEPFSLKENDRAILRNNAGNSFFKRQVPNNLDNFIRAMDHSFRVPYCFFGWMYARLTVTGEVIPCCGCLGHSMGNYKQTEFSEIWYGDKYDEFRRKSWNIHSDAYFLDCSCKRSCPHYMPIVALKDVAWRLY